MSDEKYKHFLLMFGYWAAITAIVYVLCRYAFAYTLPFLIGLAVSALLQPAVRFLSSKLRIRRGIVGVILVLFVYLILAGLILLVFVRVVGGMVDLVKVLPGTFSNTVAPALNELGEKLMALLAMFDDSAVGMINDSMPEIISAISGAVTNFSVGVVTWASGVAVNVPGALLAAVVCVIVSIFMTADYDKMTAFFRAFLPERTASVFGEAARGLKTILGNYAKSYLMIMFITFAEIAVGLLIIGVKRAALIALAVAVFDILPIVGSGMVLLPWTVVALIQGETVRGIGLAVLYIIVAVARQIFEPKIVGKNIGLHPLATLFCMWIGVKLFGGIGLFGLPITVLIIKHLMESGVIPGRGAAGEVRADREPPA